MTHDEISWPLANLPGNTFSQLAGQRLTRALRATFADLSLLRDARWNCVRDPMHNVGTRRSPDPTVVKLTAGVTQGAGCRFWFNFRSMETLDIVDTYEWGRGSIMSKLHVHSSLYAQASWPLVGLPGNALSQLAGQRLI